MENEKLIDADRNAHIKGFLIFFVDHLKSLLKKQQLTGSTGEMNFIINEFVNSLFPEENHYLFEILEKLKVKDENN